MKNLLLTTALIFATFAASAQISAFKQGNSDKTEGYALPRTLITVKITQEREIIIKGPYARYASQYLGIASVPMSDKENYKLINAQVSYYFEPDPSHLFALDPKGDVSKVFTWLVPTIRFNESEIIKTDDTNLITPFVNVGVESPETLAAEAADIISRIRKKRVELVTGEIGDGTYGAGVKDALIEMDKIEAEYLAMFIGKRHVETSVKYITVLPEVGKERITALRFSNTKGVVAESDITGRPINLEFVPERKQTPPTPVTNKKPRLVYYRIPQISTVKLVDGQNTLETVRIPIYQSGTGVEIPVL